jgi:hypothetical protein
MRDCAGLRVECEAAKLCRWIKQLARPGGRFAASPRTLEDGLLQAPKSAQRVPGFSVLFLALCFALGTPALFAQTSEGPPADDSSNPGSVTATSGATKEQLQLAREQGKTDTALLDWVLANSGPLKGDTHAGEMRIAFTITPAEGWWDKAAGGTLAWHEAPDYNVHLRIFVLDLADGRLIPGLTVRATLIDANGNEQSAPADFGWYPLLNAYGGNVPLDADSSYTLRVTIDPPPHVFSSGERFAKPTTAEFPPVPLIQEAMAELPLATTTAAANEAELLKPCNAALTAAITALWQQSVSGAEKPAGDYFVGYALDYSGLAMPIGGAKLHLRNLVDFSGKDSVRLELLIRDSRTGRLIPALRPRASLTAPDGKVYGAGELPLYWHPWLNHYGLNARIPRKDVYKLRVRFDAPGFRRWGRQSERFAAPAEVEFDSVSLKPGKKD